jgi:hypothetical protein
MPYEVVDDSQRYMPNKLFFTAISFICGIDTTFIEKGNSTPTPLRPNWDRFGPQ